jgi:rhodanese-related sulfurtransferase
MISDNLKIDVTILSGWLVQKKGVTVLDMRPKSERADWSIRGSIHADVYDSLKAGDERALDSIELNVGAPIVTVCAAGRTSRIAANFLKGKGYDAYSLEGGMKAWNFALNT